MGHNSKRGNTEKNRSHLENWVTLKTIATIGKVGHTEENGSQSKQWVTFGKICHTVK